MLRRSTDYYYFLQYFPSKPSQFVSNLLSSTIPFISDIDLIKETIIIYNPSSSLYSFKGYTISDYHKRHIFSFPDDFILEPYSSVIIYCCPGKIRHVEDIQENHLLWTNSDGTLRRKEVLNNDGDTVYLANNSNVVISSCSRNLNELSVTETILNNHPMHLFLLRTIATCCYLRLLSLFVLLVATSLRWHGIIIDSFILSMFFDFLSRLFCFWLHGSSDQLDILSSSLSSLGDRLSFFSIILSCILAVTSFSSSTSSQFIIPLSKWYPTLFVNSDPSIELYLVILFLSGVIVLEITSSWMYLIAEILITKSKWALTSNERTRHHIGYHDEDGIDYLKYYSPIFYSLLTIFAELTPLVFYLHLYDSHSLSNNFNIIYYNLFQGFQFLSSYLPFPPEISTGISFFIDIILLSSFLFKLFLLIIQFVASTSRLSLEVISQRTKENIFKID